MGFAACNNEWEDEQYLLQASFKANVTDQGVTTTYVRFNSGGVVKYNLPILMSGSTVNTQNRTIHIGLDPDTLAVLNEEQYGHREELYFRQLPNQYYNMPESFAEDFIAPETQKEFYEMYAAIDNGAKTSAAGWSLAGYNTRARRISGTDAGRIGKTYLVNLKNLKNLQIFLNFLYKNARTCDIMT